MWPVPTCTHCSELFYIVRKASLKLWIFVCGFILLLSFMFFWFIHYKKEKFHDRVETRTTLRYHFTPVKMSSKYWEGCGGEGGTLLHCQLEWNKYSHQTTKNKTTMWPSYSLLGKCPENSTSCSNDIHTFMFNCCSILQYHKNGTNMPIDWWIDNANDLYIQNGILFRCREN